MMPENWKKAVFASLSVTAVLAGSYVLSGDILNGSKEVGKYKVGTQRLEINKGGDWMLTLESGARTGTWKNVGDEKIVFKVDGSTGAGFTCGFQFPYGPNRIYLLNCPLEGIYPRI